MKRRARAARHAGRLGVGVLVLASCLASAHGEPDERGLWTLWQAHARPPHDHEALLADCLEFTGRHRGDPLAVVSGTLAGWHLLQLGREDEARKRFEAYADGPSGSLNRGAQFLSRAWLTRLDREQVRQALQAYYRKHVAYPRRLDALKTAPAVPAPRPFPETDRWDMPWTYRLTGFATLPGMLDQKYLLESRRLGETSDLADALAVPCGGRLHLEPVRLRVSAPGREMLELRRLPEPADGDAAGGDVPADGSAGSIVVGVGSWFESVYLAYVGRHIMIVSDTLHWNVLPRPAAP